MSTIGDNIKFLREHHKFTPGAVAKKLDINVQDYNAWETGLLLPTIDKVMSICAIYKVSSPTELFSESFIQQYNAKDVKAKKAEAIRKAQEEANFNQATDAKLSFVIPDGSYYYKPFFFNLAIFMAFALMVSLFAPFFIQTPSSAFAQFIDKDNLITTVLVACALLFSLIFVIIAIKFNFKVVEHNEFFPKKMATRMKLFYLAMPLIIAGLVAANLVLKGQPFKILELVQAGIAAVMFLSSFIALLTIRPAKPSSITYNYVMKFSKYRLRSDGARKCLLTFAIIGLALGIIALAAVVLQLMMDGGVIGLIGVKSGFIKDFSDGFIAIFNHVNTGLAATIVLGASFALYLYTQIVDIIISRQLKQQYHKGDIKAEQAQDTKMLNIGNIVAGILTYVLSFATVILGLIANADARVAAAQYYVVPILTAISIFVVIRVSVNIKVHFAYRGAETKEVTGFSEVKLDEQAKERKQSKKPSKQPKEKQPKQNKKAKGVEQPQQDTQEQNLAQQADTAQNVQGPTLQPNPSAQPVQPTQPTAPVQPGPAPTPVAPSAPQATSTNNDTDNKGGQN